MSATLAVAGWLAALAVATAWRIVLARRMELVARACHELRGPLTSARLAVRLAARSAGADAVRGTVAGGGNDVARPRGDVLQAIDLELGRAGLALADLDAAQQGGRAGDRLQTFALAPLLDDAADAWRGTAWTRGRRLRVEHAPGTVLLRGDRLRLAQAVGNLLANAIEHGGGTVRLRARASAHTVRIEVLDEGPGLPAPIGELTRRPRSGRGLRGRGLAIAQDVAARYGGRLAAAPSELGARLVIELPTAPASESPPPPP
ncbi:MAG TPA: HAMP domain-containing sensor histidine kinase, partial [Conexibacter sp.]|nr:HAMP domain-containing sensor histidine kinase [Conexibacter sp.]